jgi:hypothetical protein
MSRILRITLFVDGIIAVAFGLFSWLFPLQTYGSVISIPNEQYSIFFSILSSLSLFYFVIGITCLIGFKSTYPISFWIALLMLARHLLEGGIKIADIGKTWLIGNPYQDIVIHSIFLIAYLVGLTYTNRKVN